MTVDERKRVELSLKLDALDTELDNWLEVTSDQAPLEKHHHQLRRIVADLRPLAILIRTDAEADGSAEHWRRIEREILDLHRVWDFYRERLALRFVPWLHDYLVLADEFAWATYRPAQAAAVRCGGVAPERVREPPLVSLSSVSSPFSISRGSPLVSEIGRIGSARAGALIDALPIPLISVPWSQLGHLPDALITGHEVGHLVLHDFGLARTAAMEVEKALTGSSEASRGRWRGWLEEVFCDVYGALAGGPAFPLSLGDFLLVNGVDPTSDGGPGYPPSAVRLAVAIAALARADCATDDLDTRFAGLLAGLGDQLRNEIDDVARALVTKTFAGLGESLAAVLAPDQLWAARDDAERVLQGWQLQSPDIRTVVASAAYAFSAQPRQYRDLGVTAAVLRHAAAIQQAGLRFRGGGTDRDDDAVAAADLARGPDLYAILTGTAPVS